MRTLELNKVSLWYVSGLEWVEIKDEDGYYTGEKEQLFGTPTLIRINIYPYDDKIHSTSFGKDASLDMVGVTTDIILDKDGLLFHNEPSGDYSKTYDYSVSSIGKSLNSKKYGLKART